MNISLVHLAPKKSWIELYDKNNDNNTVSLFEMNVSLVHPAPQESLWIELYDKNTFVSFLSIIIIMHILYLVNDNYTIYLIDF